MNLLGGRDCYAIGVASATGGTRSQPDNLGRLNAIKDDDGGSPDNTLAQCTWVGLSTMVIEDFQQPDVKLDYFGGTSGTYALFDNFDRVVDQKWIDYGPDTYGLTGNLQIQESPGGGRKTTTWDYENQPVLYELSDGSRVTMTYNADNRRISKET